MTAAERIRELRAMLTDETWHEERRDNTDGYITHAITDGRGTQIARVEEGCYPDGELLRARRDAALIAALHNAAADLLAVAEAAQKWIDYQTIERHGLYQDGIPGDLMDALDAFAKGRGR